VRPASGAGMEGTGLCLARLAALGQSGVAGLCWAPDAAPGLSTNPSLSLAEASRIPRVSREHHFHHVPWSEAVGSRMWSLPICRSSLHLTVFYFSFPPASLPPGEASRCRRLLSGAASLWSRSKQSLSSGGRKLKLGLCLPKPRVSKSS